MQEIIYGLVCLFFGAAIGFFVGLLMNVQPDTPPQPMPGSPTAGVAYDAMSEPTPEPMNWIDKLEQEINGR